MTGPHFLRAFIAPAVASWLTFGGASAAAQRPSSAAPPDAAQPVVAQYDFALELPVRGRHIVGEARLTFASAPTVDTLRLDLDAAMHVREVWMGCADARGGLAFAHDGNILRVAVPASVVDSGGRCLTVRYDGEPADGLIVSTDSAGRWAAFGDNFPNRARHWLPTQDHPSRKAPVVFRVTAPAGLTVVANGAFVSAVTGADGRVTTTWREDRPIPTYGMVIAAAPLAAYDLGRTACGLAEDAGCVPQVVWTAPEQASLMPGRFVNAGAMVEFFARTVAPYPYEKLGHVQSMTRYGGMENPSAIFYFDRGFRTPDGIDDGLIAHETAHQWFGDAVTEREWAHVWLSEGFATFFAALWAQHARGDSAYAAEMARARTQVLRSEVATRRAVIDSVETDPNALLNENSYQKGGVVLRMLRDELGDSAFFAGLRRYYAAHRHGNALTQDLQRALEAASGRALGWFFDQWLRRPGWAELRTAFAWDRSSQRATLLVEQEGRFGLHRMSVPLDVVDASGAHHRVTVSVEALGSQSVVLPGRWAAPPVSVVCDPDLTLLAVCTSK